MQHVWQSTLCATAKAQLLQWAYFCTLALLFLFFKPNVLSSAACTDTRACVLRESVLVGSSSSKVTDQLLHPTRLLLGLCFRGRSLLLRLVSCFRRHCVACGCPLVSSSSSTAAARFQQNSSQNSQSDAPKVLPDVFYGDEENQLSVPMTCPDCLHCCRLAKPEPSLQLLLKSISMGL